MVVGAGKAVKVKSAGSEFVTSITYFTLKDDGSVWSTGSATAQTISYSAVNLGNNLYTTSSGFQVGHLIAAHAFDWAPLTYFVATKSGSPSYIVPIGELFNYTVLYDDVLKRIHDVALLSLLDVPNMGKTI